MTVDTSLDAARETSGIPDLRRIGVNELLAGAPWRPPFAPCDPLPRADDPPSPRSWTYDPMRNGPGWGHLTRRFLWSLRPGGPSEPSLQWAHSVLTAPERVLFDQMPGYDRRHAIGIGRLAAKVSGDHVVARAGILHDVGKIECRLGPFGRAAATLFRRALPVSADRLSRSWYAKVAATPDGRLRPRTWLERFAAYWMHPWTGRLILERAGVDEAVAAWAEQHHHLYVVEDLVFDWDSATLLWELDRD